MILMLMAVVSMAACENGQVVDSSSAATPSISSSANFSNKTTSSYIITSSNVLAINSYNEFLTGKINAIDNSGNASKRILSITDVVGTNKSLYSIVKFGYFDMNGDSLPELIIFSDCLYIFTYQNDQVVWWVAEPYYSIVLANGAILIKRDSAPDGDAYEYLLYDFYGKNIFALSFSKLYGYDSNANGHILYTFDGINISENLWNALTQKYLSISSALINWENYDAVAVK